MIKNDYRFVRIEEFKAPGYGNRSLFMKFDSRSHNSRYLIEFYYRGDCLWILRAFVFSQAGNESLSYPTNVQIKESHGVSIQP